MVHWSKVAAAPRCRELCVARQTADRQTQTIDGTLNYVDGLLAADSN